MVTYPAVPASGDTPERPVRTEEFATVQAARVAAAKVAGASFDRKNAPSQV